MSAVPGASSLTLLRERSVLRTLVLALLARVPLAAIGLLLVLQIRALDHPYALAGVCSGACALGMAVGSPLLGRAVDRIGQPPVLLGAGAAVVLSTVAFALLPAATPAAVFVAVAALIGLAQPPVGACVRVVWQRLLDKPRFSALVTLDASLQELAFMAGPLALVGAASAFGPATALVVTGVLLGATSVLFAALPETRRLGGAAPAPGAQGAAPRVSPLSVPGVRMLLAVATMMGVAFGATELGILTVAEQHDASGLAGVLLALWGVGSFAGGLVWAQRGPVVGRAWWMRVFLVTLGATSLLLAASPDLWTLGAGLVLAGAAIAPLFGVLYALMAEVAPADAMTEAFTWETSAITGGIAIGSAAAGAVAGGAGATWTFAVAGVAFLAGAALTRTGRRTALEPAPAW